MPDPLTALFIAAVFTVITAVFFWPDRGLWPRWRQGRRMTERVLIEDALKHIHKYEMNGRRPTLSSIAGALHASMDETAELLAEMQANGLVDTSGGEIHLTTNGRDAALHIIRAHRLYEQYLAEETGYGEAEWHGQAERFEHSLTPTQANALAMRLGNPTHDPHGDPIPTSEGNIVTHGGQPLTALPPEAYGTIVHLEDEPDIVYAQLIAIGLHPGMSVRVIESTAQRVRLWVNGDEHVLAPIVAANISVVLIPTETAVEDELPADSQRLSMLAIGKQGKVIAISNKCRGVERRRFMDLGILPGAIIKAEMRSPSNDPTAYIIRDALIALRKNQADLINVQQL